jgi:GNAT superfamily N-acetyltransferase
VVEEFMDIQLAPAQIARPEDLPSIASLLEVAFGPGKARGEELAWQYLQNPCGEAIYVNAHDESGQLMAHYAVIPTFPFLDPKFSGLKTYLSLNTAVHPKAQGKGLFKKTAQAVYNHLADLGDHAVLGVANENSVYGFINYLGFHLLGQLKVEAYFPGFSPAPEAPRLLAPGPEGVRWRLARPARGYQVSAAGQMVCTRPFKGLPVHCILTAGGLDVSQVQAPAYGRLARMTRPAIYATYGPTSRFAWLVPEILRPSPFHLICRPSLHGPVLPLLNHIQARRFELFDFDVV